MIRTTLGLLVVLLTVACSEPSIETMPVTVSGTITAPEGAPGETVYVRLFHAWALEGALRHPLHFIEDFETTPGSFTHTLAYPVGGGEGLVIYAWLDGDGDGVLCTPTVRDELAGLVEISDFPANSVHAELVLTQPCAGPDWFFPAAAD